MKNSVMLIFGALLFYMAGACQSGSRNEGDEDTAGPQSMEQSLPEKNEPLEFRGTKILGERDTVSFEITKTSFVKIKLSTPGDTGNIRINQLLMPNGDMDGPFGKDYEDSLHSTGIYQLIIAESMMAENPYTGEYQVEIAIK